LVVCGNISHLRAGVGVGVTIGPCLGIITGLYSGVITGAGVKMAGFFLQYLNQFIDLNDKACRSNNRSDCGKSKLLNRVSAGKLFRGLLNGLLPQNEIEEAWQKIQSDFREVGQAE